MRQVYKRFKGWLGGLQLHIRDLPDVMDAPERYRLLRRNMVILVFTMATVPLIVMTIINYHQYQKSLKKEVFQGLRIQAYRMKTSVDYFITDHLAALKFVSSAIPGQGIHDNRVLQQVFLSLKKEFPGFIDLGLIDQAGSQITYFGPYELTGKKYVDQAWFQEAQVRGTHVSEVFLGYRKFPHFVIAVQHREESGETWILRATVDTNTLYNLLVSRGVESDTDAFILNRSGTLQTTSKYYGQAMDEWPLPLPPTSYEPVIREDVDPYGKKILMAYCYLTQAPFIVVATKPHETILETWYRFKGRGGSLTVLILSSVGIFLVIFKLSDLLVKRMRECDQKRESAYQQAQHAGRLASIGRLAAGVAHEINNPLAIINEKAGLLKDLIEISSDFPHRERFLPLAISILQSVDRCRNVTRRLLGFARRMDVQREALNLNGVIEDVLGFIRQEALYRKVDIRLELSEDLPRIVSDRGQLQQVFLNIVNNALDAVGEGGTIAIVSWEPGQDTVAVSIQDDGIGMSEETQRHIFEPFFSTKKEKGTGLGLSITYGIVKRLGGDIRVQSKEGIGTTFTVSLPKKDVRGGGISA